MNLSERNKAVKEIFEDECFAILESKGSDYMRADAWDQFEQLAEMLNLTPLQVMYVYMHKHLKAIETAMRDGRLKAECLEDKLKDVANYALMMVAYNREAE